MDLGLRDRIVVVTGASKGIGFACAQAFAAEGARVALVSRSRANLDAALAKIRHFEHRPEAFTADLTEAAQAQSMVDEVESALGPIEILISSAGAAKRYPPDDLRAAAWHDAMDAKFFSYIYPLDAIVKLMGARGHGSIVNIIGAGGKIASSVHLPGGAANAALMLATSGLAAAYGPKGVRINAINPGATLTDRMQQGLDAEAKMTGLTREEILERQQTRIPLRRLCTPEEIAQVALFLASSQASYVTGAIVPMDGGAAAVI
ncbi:MAG TPA: SDR family oxidoreductase [Casimicrobiaceae bacterium]|nr:SDR family oxidoreductase [Casimicrobiaceae bacterium]